MSTRTCRCPSCERIACFRFAFELDEPEGPEPQLFFNCDACSSTLHEGRLVPVAEAA